MRAGPRRRLFGAAVALSVVLVDASTAMAQLTQSDIPPEAETSETTALVTSSTEVRRAVIGLLILAVAIAVLAVLYWRRTGEQARERHLSERGGRHQTVEPVADVAIAPAIPVVPELAYAGSQPVAPPGGAPAHSVFDLDPPTVQVANNRSQEPYPDSRTASAASAYSQASGWAGPDQHRDVSPDDTISRRPQTSGRDLFG